MKVSNLKPTSFLSKLTSGILNIPFSVKGHSATFFLDTGAELSIISDKEAHALGLTSIKGNATLGDSAGVTSTAQIAEIGELKIGSIRLKHVPFLVLPASNPPFDELPLDMQGLLGIQVALALQTVGRGADGHLDLASRTDPGTTSLRLTFDDSMPILHVTYLGKLVPFTFDTGAERTTLNLPFLENFPEVAKTGTEKRHKMEGVNGTLDARAIELPTWKVDLNGRTATVSNMPILLQKTTGFSEWAVGNFGLNLLQQVEPFTIDFKRMQLVVGSVDGH